VLRLVSHHSSISPGIAAAVVIRKKLVHPICSANHPAEDESSVRPSTGSVGDCFDNAHCESFFATLERELLNRRPFQTQAEARMAILEFREGWYNPRRRHSALDYESPMNYEGKHQAAA
jgi:transposase InsO family protein